jgi:hypothetical protein
VDLDNCFKSRESIVFVSLLFYHLRIDFGFAPRTGKVWTSSRVRPSDLLALRIKAKPNMLHKIKPTLIMTFINLPFILNVIALLVQASPGPDHSCNKNNKHNKRNNLYGRRAPRRRTPQ